MEESPLYANECPVAPWLVQMLVAAPFRLSEANTQSVVADITLTTGELRALGGQPGWHEFMTSLSRTVGAALNYDEEDYDDVHQALLQRINKALPRRQWVAVRPHQSCRRTHSRSSCRRTGEP